MGNMEQKLRKTIHILVGGTVLLLNCNLANVWADDLAYMEDLGGLEVTADAGYIMPAEVSGAQELNESVVDQQNAIEEILEGGNYDNYSQQDEPDLSEETPGGEPIVVEVLPEGGANCWIAQPLSELLKPLQHVVLVEVTDVRTHTEETEDYIYAYAEYNLSILEELKGELTSRNIILKVTTNVKAKPREVRWVDEDGREHIDILFPSVINGSSTDRGPIFVKGGMYLLGFYYDTDGRLQLSRHPTTIQRVEGFDDPIVGRWREALFVTEGDPLVL